MESKLSTAIGHLNMAIETVGEVLDEMKSHVLDSEDSKAYENILDALASMYDGKDFLDNAFAP